MKSDKTPKISLCILIGIIIIIWLLGWIIALLYNIKWEINYVRSDSWNAYDTADATYQKLRVVWNDVENILNQISK